MGLEHSTEKDKVSSATYNANGGNKRPTLQQMLHNKANSHDLSSNPIYRQNNNRSTANSRNGDAKQNDGEKTIYIEADNKKRVQITFEISDEDNLTCGWLVSETIRQFANKNIQEPYPNRPIVALQTLDNIITLDYWLSESERSVSVLRDKMVLKPFYGDNDYLITDQKINLQYFRILKVIGTGGFSKVYLARRKDNGQFLAIKVITKKDMIKRDKEENVFNERNIMARLHHPFLVKLFYAFQTSDKLFLVMEFCPGGELFYHLNQRKKLREDEVKIYMGEIILALNYLHKNNIIYRDLKPENILLDIDGHLHLADFGLCKITRNKSDLNYTFCGSPEYMAPEIITRSGYNFSADFYTLGTLVYEMVVGRPPYLADRQKDLFDKIINQEPYYPPHISPNLKSFLSQLLEKNLKDRLGSKHGLSEIVNHPWCRDIDIVKIATKKIKAPIVPDMYRINFAREFIDARATFIDNQMSPTLNNTPSHFPSAQPETIGEMDNPGMYRKFANFSFYSNIDDPYEKFQDSIFVSNENSPENSPREEGAVTGKEFKNRRTKLFEGEILKGLHLENEAAEKIQKQQLQPQPQIKKTSSKPPYMEKSSKEDYTEELNEMSPNTKYFHKYSELETKFLNKPGGGITPQFQKQNTSSYLESSNNNLSKKPVLNYSQSAVTNEMRNIPLTYSFNQKNTKTLSEQIPAKQIVSNNNSYTSSNQNPLRMGSQNYGEVSEEIISRIDKPMVRINSNKAFSNGYQIAERNNSGKQLLNVKKVDTFSFMSQNDKSDPKTNYKNLTSDVGALRKDFKNANKIVTSERILPK